MSSVKPVLTEDLCVVQKEDIFNNMLYVCVKCFLDERPGMFIRDVRTITARVQLIKESGSKSQGA
jgi:hypothetical protein